MYYQKYNNKALCLLNSKIGDTFGNTTCHTGSTNQNLGNRLQYNQGKPHWKHEKEQGIIYSRKLGK